MNRLQTFLSVRLLVVFLALPVLVGCSGMTDRLRERSARDAKARVESWKNRGRENPTMTEEPPLTPEGRPAKLAPEDRANKPAKDAQKYYDPVADFEKASKEREFKDFIKKLREAVKKRDAEALALMMTPNFGYSMTPVRFGPGVFEYWEQNNIWRDLDEIVREPFKARDGFMVAPKKFSEGGPYSGYRAGIQLTPLGWRFAYFVTGI